MSVFGAVLFDTRSIQNYVFSGNKLKTNIGASHLVDAIYTEGMEEVLKHLGYVFPKDNGQEGIRMESDASLTAEVAFNGGGKLLLLLRPEGDWQERARTIVYTWTSLLLKVTPGLQTGAAIGELDVSDGGFQKSYESLLKQLKALQYQVLPQVDYPSSGLTLDCDVSGKVADVKGPKNRWVSQEVLSKIEASKEGIKKIEDAYADLLKDEYVFASDLADLGYKPGESYISIVHIDGNRMGSKFAKCHTLQAYKELSANVASIIHDAFRHTLSEIIASLGSYQDCLQHREDEQGHAILPIRPIIIGGDDVTFICPGRLGLTVAKLFMERVGAHELEVGGEKEAFSCCAGVAIVPAKYPFFRAYTLTEQLCGVAKQASRDNDLSWIDFALLHGEIYPSVEQLREYQYVGPEGNLHYGPYSLQGGPKDAKSIEALFALIEMMRKEMPSNKIKKLRDVLLADLHEQQCYLELSPELDKLMRKVGHKSEDERLQAVDFWEAEKGSASKVTRWLDAIECMDFMPVGKGE